MSNPNAVVAKFHNQASYEEGAEANSGVSPGQGCVLYEEDGEKYVRSADADEETTRVVREARNPPRGLGEPGESPLSQSYNEGEWVETLGFNQHDQARCRADGVSEGDAVGWNSSGHLAATGGETGGSNAVARVRETYDVDGNEFATVEFL